MDYEVIVKYNGDILFIENELNVFVEILSKTYAIISSKEKENLENLLSYSQIEYVEEPFILKTNDAQSFSSTGITSFKNKTNLTGKGTIIGIIDSGIDYNLTPFLFNDKTSKIFYYWDQSIGNSPPEGFKNGTLYTNEDINKALDNQLFIPVSTTATHGTHVSSICAEIANEAELIVVRVGNIQTDTFSRSTEFMRAIKFILDKSLELKKPVSINISYGSNEGSHRGLSLFEQYIDDMSIFWKNNIVVASGNNGDKGAHKTLNLKENQFQAEFVVGDSESILNINVWPNFIDDIGVYLITPQNVKTEILSLSNKDISRKIRNTDISGVFYDIEPYSLQRRISFELKSSTFIDSGNWQIVFEPYNIVVGNVDIYLPTSEGLSNETQFLSPNKDLTVTVPGSAKNVITVGSFNSRTGNVSIFSGEGDFKTCVFKPDLLAPGENIVAYLPGGNVGALSGTSMATPHVTGVCSLFHEWGIVNRNDLFLYSQKLKSLLLSLAKRENNISYPNNSLGYGKLNLLDIDISDLTRDKILNLTRFIKEPLVKRGIVIDHTEDFEEELSNINLNVDQIKISKTKTILILNEENEDQISKQLFMDILLLKSVEKTTQLIPMNLLTTVSEGTSGGVNENESLGVNYFKENPNLEITGRGVLIAILDTGINYLHKDFIYSDDTTKIKYIWVVKLLQQI
ncbi:MAG: S8 family serine peptidase [Peptostreptococcaceae bacterium]